MTEPFDALRRVLGGEGSTPRRFRTIAAQLLAGDVLKVPDEITARLGSDWAFFDRYREAFSEYVGVAGFRLLIDEDYKFAFLVHDEPSLREMLDKSTSRVAVACRLLFHREQQTVHLTAGVDVTMRDLYERLDLTGGVGGRTPRVKTLESLRTLARFDMVNLPSRFTGHEEERFTITPVLARRLPLTSIQEYLTRTRPRRVSSGDVEDPSLEYAPVEDTGAANDTEPTRATAAGVTAARATEGGDHNMALLPDRSPTEAANV